MILQPNMTICCAGDSITDCDCIKPPLIKKTTLMRDLGYGYVNFLYGLIHLNFPTYDVKIINHGIGGDRTIKLMNRFDQVLGVKPDILTIMIGVNDVWAKFNASDRPDVQTSVEEYTQYLEAMILKAKTVVTHIVFLSPFYLDISDNNAFIQELRQRQSVMQQLALKYNILYIDVQAAFETLLTSMDVSLLTTDFIHVNAVGHMLIAKLLFEALC
jgi:lysophospholipase L1-like esterase